jgi:hypothetical protein
MEIVKRARIFRKSHTKILNLSQCGEQTFLVWIKIPVEHHFWYESDRVTQQVDSYSFRYEFRKQLTNFEKPLSISLGAGFNPYFVNTDLIPEANYRAPVDIHLYGGGIALIPQVKYRLNEKAYLDLGFVFKIYEYQYLWTRIVNPTISYKQQQSYKQYNTFFEDNYTLRFGVYYKLKTVDDDKSKKRKVHRSKTHKEKDEFTSSLPYSTCHAK